MKTTSLTTRSFPKPYKFSLYAGAVVVLCIFNWFALQAQGPSTSLENRLAAALAEEAERDIELESWMLNISEDYLATADSEIKIEPWMLTFADDIADREPELEIEPWMLTFSDDYLDDGDADISVESWMTSTFFWGTAYLLARK